MSKETELCGSFVSSNTPSTLPVHILYYENPPASATQPGQLSGCLGDQDHNLELDPHHRSSIEIPKLVYMTCTHFEMIGKGRRNLDDVCSLRLLIVDPD